MSTERWAGGLICRDCQRKDRTLYTMDGYYLCMACIYRSIGIEGLAMTAIAPRLFPDGPFRLGEPQPEKPECFLCGPDDDYWTADYSVPVCPDCEAQLAEARREMGE